MDLLSKGHMDYRTSACSSPELECRPAAESAEAELERELHAELLREVSREQAARAARVCAQPRAAAPPWHAAGGAAGGARPGSGTHANAQLQRARAKCVRHALMLCRRGGLGRAASACALLCCVPGSAEARFANQTQGRQPQFLSAMTGSCLLKTRGQRRSTSEHFPWHALLTRPDMPGTPADETGRHQPCHWPALGGGRAARRQLPAHSTTDKRLATPKLP